MDSFFLPLAPFPRFARPLATVFSRGVTNTVTDEGGKLEFFVSEKFMYKQGAAWRREQPESERPPRARPLVANGRRGGGERAGCIHTGGWCLFPARAADFFFLCAR